MQGTSTESDTPGGLDRRRRPRTMVAVAFQLFDDRDRLLLTARTLDLSTRGALLHGICKAEIGSRVRVELSRGAARNPLSLEGTIVRLQAPPSSSIATLGIHGTAVRFEGISPLDETVLAGLIQSARA